MGNTITLPAILSALQNNCGCSSEEAADFIHALTDTITEALQTDGYFTVKGVGEFRVIDAGNERVVEFKPDSVLAQEVNAPFALFDTVDLSDGVTAEILDGAEADTPADAEPIETPEEFPEIEVPEMECAETEEPAGIEDARIPASEKTDLGTGGTVTAASAELPNGIPPVPVAVGTSQEASATPQTAAQNVAEPAGKQESASEYEPDEEPEPKLARWRRKEIVIIVLVGLLSLLAGIMAGHFGIPGLNINGVKSVKITAEEVTLLQGEESAGAIAADTTNTCKEAASEEFVDSVPSAPQDAASASPVDAAPKIVTDTVQGTNYLSRIARKHYGKDIFWVYIYEENKDKIQNPNNIRPGTVVVIPPAEKYGIDPGSKKSIQEAELLSGKILGEES